MQILNRDDLQLGGFAGLTEHQLVFDHKVGGNSDSWDGIGNFVYLADAIFQPKGETRMHPHKEIDVISIMVAGRITHEGSLEHGTSIVANQAQAQRAGGEGFIHNEINPDDEPNRMLQLWVLPETDGEVAKYKSYDLEHGKLTPIYGGGKDQDETLDSHTIMEAGIFSVGQEISRSGKFMAYVVTGIGTLNNTNVKNGDLVKGQNINFTALADNVLLVVITTKEF